MCGTRVPSPDLQCALQEHRGASGGIPMHYDVQLHAFKAALTFGAVLEQAGRHAP